MRTALTVRRGTRGAHARWRSPVRRHVPPGRRRTATYAPGTGFTARLIDVDWIVVTEIMLDNEPALRLYGKLGFREAYQC